MHNNRSKITQGQPPKVNAIGNVGANLFQNNFVIPKQTAPNGMVKTFYGGKQSNAGQPMASPIIVGNQFA